MEEKNECGCDFHAKKCGPCEICEKDACAWIFRDGIFCWDHRHEGEGVLKHYDMEGPGEEEHD